jgi:hypothetical protein
MTLHRREFLRSNGLFGIGTTEPSRAGPLIYAITSRPSRSMSFLFSIHDPFSYLWTSYTQREVLN